nr:transposase [Candidatus Frankia alpina]
MDHHFDLVDYPPKVAVSTLVNSLNGVSARRLRSEHTSQVNRYNIRGHFRSPPYFTAPAGGTQLALSREYVDRQQRSAATR